MMPDLKVMLVFAQEDHAQAAQDKPHIHQAFQGFRFEARLWVRLNPDRAYVQSLIPTAGMISRITRPIPSRMTGCKLDRTLIRDKELRRAWYRWQRWLRWLIALILGAGMKTWARSCTFTSHQLNSRNKSF